MELNFWNGSKIVPLLAALTSFVDLADPSSALVKLVDTGSRLPSASDAHVSVYDGDDSIYLVGLLNTWDVVKYSISTGQVDTVGSFMSMYNGAAFMLGEDIICFGGRVINEPINSQVYSYSTITNTYSVVDNLPIETQNLAVAWDFGTQAAYLFGARNARDAIYRYNVTALELESVGKLPTGIFGASGVWDSNEHIVYTFGGYTVPDLNFRAFRYDPNNGSAIEFHSNIRTDCCATYVNDNLVYIISHTDLYGFDPSQQREERMNVAGWPWFDKSSCVYVPKLNRIYIMGGYYSYDGGDLELRDQILYLDWNHSTDSPSTTVEQDEPTVSTSEAATSEETTEYSTSEAVFTDQEVTTQAATTEATSMNSTHQSDRDDLSTFWSLLIVIPSVLIMSVFVYFALRHCKHGGGFLCFREFVENKRDFNLVITRNKIFKFHEGSTKGHRKSNEHALHEHDITSQPYDQTLELDEGQVSVDTLQILGSGKFGIVFLGTDLRSGKPVAVKTVKKNCKDVQYIEALMSEIKILTYLSHHVHIVNLIGARTNQLKEGIIYLFVDVCNLGDLESYLRKHKHTITNCHQSNSLNAMSSTKCPKTCSLDYVSTCDLFLWSTQICSGMEYLGTKKVIHGDLATRNILLYDKSCIKITDFGLAKKLNNYRNYIKMQDVPLPWRSMSIESLRQMKFSIQSDVWSFGVTLWEIFSLGSIPYTAITQFSDNFVKRLLNGDRLQKPELSSETLYHEMLKCWCLNPGERPHFCELTKRLDELNQESVHNDHPTLAPSTQFSARI